MFYYCCNLEMYQPSTNTMATLSAISRKLSWCNDPSSRIITEKAAATSAVRLPSRRICTTRVINRTPEYTKRNTRIYGTTRPSKGSSVGEKNRKKHTVTAVRAKNGVSFFIESLVFITTLNNIHKKEPDGKCALKLFFSAYRPGLTDRSRCR